MFMPWFHFILGSIFHCSTLITIPRTKENKTKTKGKIEPCTTIQYMYSHIVNAYVYVVIIQDNLGSYQCYPFSFTLWKKRENLYLNICSSSSQAVVFCFTRHESKGKRMPTLKASRSLQMHLISTEENLSIGFLCFKYVTETCCINETNRNGFHERKFLCFARCLSTKCRASILPIAVLITRSSNKDDLLHCSVPFNFILKTCKPS